MNIISCAIHVCIALMQEHFLRHIPKEISTLISYDREYNEAKKNNRQTKRGKEGEKTRHAATRRTERYRRKPGRNAVTQHQHHRKTRAQIGKIRPPPNVALPHHYSTLSSKLFKCIVLKSQNEKVIAP